jgi:hypothetical protein
MKHKNSSKSSKTPLNLNHQINRLKITDVKPIAWAEMAAALVGLIWLMAQHLSQPATITLCID